MGLKFDQEILKALQIRQLQAVLYRVRASPFHLRRSKRSGLPIMTP